MAFPEITKTIKSMISGFSDAFKNSTKGLAGSVWDGIKGGFAGLASAIGLSTKALFAFSVVGAAAAAAIGVIVWKATEAKRANEQMEKSFSEFQDAQSKANELNGELETTKQKIAELEGKSSLTFIEQSELNKLRETNRLLEIQADLAEKGAHREAKESAEDSADAFWKNYKDEISQDRIDEIVNHNTANGLGLNGSLDNAKDISSMIAGINIATQMRDASEEGSDDWLYFNQLISDATDEVWAQTDSLVKYKENLEAIPFEDLGADGKNAIKEIDAAIDLIYKNLDSSKWKDMRWNDIISGGNFEDDISGLKKLAEQSELTADALEKQAPRLSQALINGGFTLDEVVDQINASVKTVSDKTLEKVNENRAQMENEILKALNPKGIMDSKYMADKAGLAKMSDSELALAYHFVIEADVDAGSLDVVKEKIQEFVASGKKLIPEDEKLSFEALIADDSEGSFKKTTDDYVSKIQTLGEAIKKIHSGEMSPSDLHELQAAFPELADDADNLEQGIKELMSSMDAGLMKSFLDKSMYMASDEDLAKLQGYMKTIQEMRDLLDQDYTLNIDVEASGIESFMSAIKESVSSTGLSEASIKSLTARYKDLETVNFDSAKLFEKTANGIHLNTKAVRELESAYESERKQQNAEELKRLTDSYNDLTAKINEAYASGKTADVSGLYSQRDIISQQIQDTTTLIAQYEGLTSAYHKWEQAQSMGEEGDMYDSLAGSLGNIKELYDEGLIGTNKFRAAVQLMSYDDVSDLAPEKLVEIFDDSYPRMKEYFTEGQKGCKAFLKDVNKLNKDWAHLNEDGKWEIDFGVGGDEQVAHDLGISVDAVQSILRKLSDFGFNVNLDSLLSIFDTMDDGVEKLNDKLIELGKTDIKFNFEADGDELDDEIEKAKQLLANLKGDVNVDTSEVEAAEKILEALINRKNALSTPSIMAVDTSQLSKTNEELAKAIDLLQSFHELSGKTNLSTPESAEFKQTISELEKLTPEVKAELGLDTEEFDAALANIASAPVDVHGNLVISEEDIAAINEAIASIDVTALDLPINPPETDEVLSSLKEVNEYTLEDKNFTVTVMDSASSTLKRIKGDVEDIPTSRTITVTVKTDDKSGTLTASSSKTTTTTKSKKIPEKQEGNLAFAQGTSGAKKTGKALGGELGEELVVRDGKYFTIGSNGAEFFDYKKGDIVFNADQTRQILKNGRISNGPKRGIALAEGNAFSNGDGGFFEGGGSSKSTDELKKAAEAIEEAADTMAQAANDIYPVTPGGYAGGAVAAAADAGDTDKFDWIELAIDRIERSIAHLETTAQSTYHSVEERLTATYEQIDKVTEEIDLQRKAYERYRQEAESVGLSAELAEQVRNGAIDISKYDENTQNLIDEYQEWYEKSLDCADSIDELNENLGELYQQNFDTIAQEYENQISQIEHVSELYNTALDEIETRGYLVDSSVFTTLMETKAKEVNALEQELADLNGALAFAVANGVKEGTEAWYEMKSSINDVEESIAEAKVELIDFEKQAREADWTYFDFLLERISQITDEANFLIDLMDDAKKYDIGGALSDEGLAAVGLYMQNYNVYMAQSEKYAQELEKINAELSKDPNDTELIERRENLLGLQQDCILAAKKEKKAIADLYEENFKNIQSEYDNQLGLIEHLTNSYNAGLDEIEKLGYRGGEDLYEALINAESQKIGILEDERKSLIRAMSEAVASGEIEEGSDEWYAMQDAINGVTEEIADARNNVLDFSNELRKMKWDNFDYLEEKISQITQEADFLIDLMSNKKLFQDNGQFNNEGMATAGLHAQNYNVYMSQADDYTNEIRAIEEELANDPYNTDLIKRREELLELQREAILAAENEKDAIVDLVKEGIEIELDALQELISKYKNSLSAAKTLYEYQARVEEQSSDIASLQKQISAYEGDTSEESQAKIQKLNSDLAKAQKDLQETEYDKYVSDTQDMLDDLFDEYSDILNRRLDDVDALISDVIDMVNQNAITIDNSVTEASRDVGYTLSDAMSSIWDTAGYTGRAVTDYQADFDAQITSTNAAIGDVITNTTGLFEKGNEIAMDIIFGTSATTEAMNLNTGTVVDTVNANATSISATITTACANVGYTLSAAMTNIWNGSTGLNLVVAQYGGDMSKKLTSINSVLYGISSSLSGLASTVSTQFAQKSTVYNPPVKSSPSTPSTPSPAPSTPTQPSNPSTPAKSNRTLVDSDYYGVASAIFTGSGGWGTGAELNRRLTEKGFNANYVNSIVTLMRSIGDWYAVAKEYGITNVDLFSYNRYLHGGLVDYTGLAQLDGSPGKPELVLNAADTKNFIELKDVLRKMSSQNLRARNGGYGMMPAPLNGLTDVSSFLSRFSKNYFNENSNTGDISIDISIDHVEDYNDFVAKLQKDRQFEKLVRSMTTDRITGGSSLAKNKYRMGNK